ncbi:hypothetical protein OIU84_024967 [Salix udensis]|uniref:ABC transmembrane type-1 domain-containing protein n=1 Tax=Salix udensis TaxID=889485 RepID=A0AAD6PBW9_9ROSI|nr:hypothetical protein OIU84_024967 [Salix udensis]
MALLLSDLGSEGQKVKFHKLFTFADRLDVVLMIVGTLSAIANGLSQPLMTLIFGQLINSFGASDRSNIVKEVSKVALNFVYLAVCVRARAPKTGMSPKTGMPSPTSVHDDEFEQNIERNVKPEEVSFKRLAYLNKPELPVLFLGTVAAVIHGVIFPVFGLLLSKAINMFYEPPKEIRKDSKFWAVLYLGLGFVTFAALPLQYYLFGIAGGKDSAASIFAILDRKPKIDSSRDEGLTLPHVKGNIEIEHVSFKYPMRPHVQIFRDLSPSIPSGKTVALVGESGSGKSTVISLIERFYDPDSGHVYLDSVEISKFKLNWLRQQMGLITDGAYASLVALHMSAT